MNLRKKLEEDLKVSLKGRDELKVSVIRFVLAAIINREIEKQKEVEDEEVIQILEKQVKQRKESIEAFRVGKREDLAAKEEKEVEILSKYLPQKLSDRQLEKVVRQVIDQLKAGSSDFGKVMGLVMAKVKGKAEGGRVSEVVKKLLI